jgi:serine/threonine protein kinase
MTSELSPGAVVAGFHVESILGRGAMAEVYRARDEAGGRVVALKLLDNTLLHDERFRQRFLRESELATSLDHPHIVPTLASGEDGGRLYLALELIDGPDLRQLLRQGGRLEPERAVALVEQVADALDAAHKAGLVHRDVKPGNILVRSEDGQDHAYVCDFGLARHVSSVSSLTGDRGFVGTIDYVPPEQIEGGSIDARADVYSLGCVLYECLTGVRPFDRDSELSVVFAHLNEPPPKLTDVRPELPAAFDEVIATALAKSPDERYSSAGELAAAARAALRGEVVARRRPRRRLLAAGVATTVVVAAAATAAGLLLTGKTHHALPVTITPTELAGAKLGKSTFDLQSLWGNPYQKVSMQTPPNYSELTQQARHLSAYFVGTTDKTVEIATWNSSDRTAEGVGPCSTVAQLKKAYGSRLKPAPGNVHNGVVSGYTVGKSLFFAIDNKTNEVQAVALYSNQLNWAGFNALNDGPCAAGRSNVFTSRPAVSSPATSPASTLAQTLVSHHFTPRLTVRVPPGWSVRADTARDFTLASRTGPSIHFRLDPLASTNGAPLASVSTTPPGLAAWLQHDRSLVVSAPKTTLLGHPALDTRSVDISPSGNAPVTYFTFRGGASSFPVRSSPGKPVRLYLTSIRIDTLVHTLAIAVDAPSKTALDAVLPTAQAIVSSLAVAAVPVQGLSPLSSYCTNVFGGTCLGELTAGTHSTRTFEPALTYTVPVGWTNFGDHPTNVGFVPPGGDWNAVDPGKSDYLGIFRSIAAARPGCAEGQSAIQTPARFVRFLEQSPGLSTTRPLPVTIGGLSGYVVDLRMRAGFKMTCPYSQHMPTVQVITSRAPGLTGLAHNVAPRPFAMRLYLLRYRGGTLGIEIDEVSGSSKLDAYSAVVKSFRFKLS